MTGELISRLPDDEAYLSLLMKFDNLLKKYARLLNYEDAYEDLRLFFLELVLSMKNKEIALKNEGAIINYISFSVKNQAIALSKKLKEQFETIFSDISEQQMSIIENIIAEENQEQISHYYPKDERFTLKEAKLLEKIYVECYSISELSKEMGVSRQAINQMKKRALGKIKQNLID